MSKVFLSGAVEDLKQASNLELSNSERCSNTTIKTETNTKQDGNDSTAFIEANLEQRDSARCSTKVNPDLTGTRERCSSTMTEAETNTEQEADNSSVKEPALPRSQEGFKEL